MILIIQNISLMPMSIPVDYQDDSSSSSSSLRLRFLSGLPCRLRCERKPQYTYNKANVVPYQRKLLALRTECKQKWSRICMLLKRRKRRGKEGLPGTPGKRFAEYTMKGSVKICAIIEDVEVCTEGELGAEVGVGWLWITYKSV